MVTAYKSKNNTNKKFITHSCCRIVISTGVGEASSVGAGRCAYRICFQPSPLTSLTAKSDPST